MDVIQAVAGRPPADMLPQSGYGTYAELYDVCTTDTSLSAQHHDLRRALSSDYSLPDRYSTTPSVCHTFSGTYAILTRLFYVCFHISIRYKK